MSLLDEEGVFLFQLFQLFQLMSVVCVFLFSYI